MERYGGIDSTSITRYYLLECSLLVLYVECCNYTDFSIIVVVSAGNYCFSPSFHLLWRTHLRLLARVVKTPGVSIKTPGVSNFQKEALFERISCQDPRGVYAFDCYGCPCSCIDYGRDSDQ